MTGDAWETFGNVPKGEGLEAWRKVLEEVTQKTRSEVLDLERAVMHPHPCSTVEQVPMALERWQTSVQAYLDAGGEPLNDERRKGSVTKILPWRIQQKILWDFDEFKTADELIAWVKKKIRLETSMAPKGREAHPLEELDGEGLQELQALGEGASQDEVNAVYRRFAGRGAQRARPGKPRIAGAESSARAPPRTTAETTCPNCLEKGHKGEDCPKPKIDLSERKCFLCKKTGHSARHCKEKGKLMLQDVESAQGGKETLAMMDADGFIPVQRMAKISNPISRSQPASNASSLSPRAHSKRRPMPSDGLCRRSADWKT